MTLIDVVRMLHSLSDEATIYAKAPWREDSLAIVAPEPALGGVLSEANELGLTYFLEVCVARDFIEGWTKTLGATPSLHQTFKRLIQYAVTDA